MAEESPTTIYIYLLDEGVDVWRPVDAIHIKENIYQINPESEIPETEIWEFLPGDMVRCEEKPLHRGNCLVAIETVKEPS